MLIREIKIQRINLFYVFKINKKLETKSIFTIISLMKINDFQIKYEKMKSKIDSTCI